MDVHSPQRGRTIKAESYRTTGKMSKSADSEVTSIKTSRRSALTQPPLHTRVAQNKSSHVQSQQELGSRFSSLPEPPRRAKSTPSTSITTPHHIPPPKPLGSTSSSSASSSPNTGSRSTDNSPNMTHKPAVTSSSLPPSSTSQDSRPSSVQSVSSHGITQAHRTAVQASTTQVLPKKPTYHPSMSVPTLAQHLDPARQRLVDRAIRARLYLLRQMGPNRFLIGGDSPDSRFHVAIGPQSCTCNKTHCIHLLFVMLRVFKVGQNDPMLWQKQLRNYEAEGLLREFQTRLTKQRTTPKRTSKKNFHFTTQRPSDLTTGGEGKGTAPSSSAATTTGGHGKSGPPREEQGSSPKSPKRLKEGGTRSYSPTKSSHSGGEESDKSDGEEDICPICLNELDEGEDLLVCSGCHNHLHQHCMDIWAGEQLRKNEEVYCPVCRAVWPYSITSSPSTSTLTPSVMPVTMPVGGVGGVAKEGLRLKSISPSQLSLSDEKRQLVERLKDIFGCGPVESLFSSDWKARETAITHLSREVVSFLMPQLTSKLHPSGNYGEQTKFREVQEMCMQTVAYACNDSVLKVFMAGLELMRVILGYSVSPTKEEANRLQKLVRPVLPVLLTRCADAQRRVKDCSIDTLCNFCLGQEGPLSIGSACGHQCPHAVTDVRFVLQTALEGQDELVLSWHWWLGRLFFIDKVLTLFSSDFILPQCILSPIPDPPHGHSDSDSSSSGSGFISPIDSITSDASALMAEIGSGSGSGPQSMESPHSDYDTTSVGMEPIARCPSPIPEIPSVVENHLLMQWWYFAAKSTHISHHKVGKVARRVIIRIAKLLRDNPYSLEIVHDVISRCHRTQAEGLLDRVLRAREKPHDTTLTVMEEDRSKREERVSPSRRKKGGHRFKTETNKKEDIESSTVTNVPVGVDVESSLKAMSLRVTNLEPSSGLVLSNDQSDLPVGRGGSHGNGREKRNSEYIGSDDSFRSAVSDLEGEESRMEEEKEKEDMSSATNSNDSRSGSGETASRSSSRGSNSSGRGTMEEGVVASGGDASQRPLSSLVRHPIYKRQSTADSAFSTDSSIDGSYFACKNNIEEEEAAAEAKVRSMLPQDVPHPSLSGLTPPTPEVLVHIQRSCSGGLGREETESTDDDGQSTAYVEGVHWAKGKLLGTGAFCSCYLARDIQNGTMFAVKQVSYSRNTKAQEEEELKRLKDEIAMMGRMNHPNIVRCLGATQHDGHINVFIEWMAGGCLDQILHDFGRPFAENVIVNYARQITHGIIYLHENGVIHRDLKGGNILCDSTGRRIRIADFGASARLATQTTGPGEFKEMEGTVAFMAPEVVRGGSVDESGQSMGYGRKCDVWSIGCVIIQMATGKAPWVGTYDVRNKFQLIFKIGQTTEPPPFPEFSNPSLKDFTIRCLEVKPEDRPTSSELLKHPLFTAL